ncbi:hypothetical protein [Desulfonatronovibrio magnus]|uniref:hypothetical protein n=1 Tax=Desulfonatronovibrio magnus TaxID=698827 RepID=UPI0005EBBE16|nr:hypothetical protein [Desulfonatronovibrio magnus]
MNFQKMADNIEIQRKEALHIKNNAMLNLCDSGKLSITKKRKAKKLLKYFFFLEKEILRALHDTEKLPGSKEIIPQFFQDTVYRFLDETREAIGFLNERIQVK